MDDGGNARVRLKELLSDVEVLAFHGDSTVQIDGLTHDSDRVRPGSCFACVPGAVVDGHDFAGAAVAAGAVALLVERGLDLGVSEAEVVSVRRALGPAAARLHEFPSRSMRCLGVTGTNGKTTCTYLLTAIARGDGDRVGLVGTTGARIDGEQVPLAHTTPEATELQELLARMKHAGVDTVAMEVSSHALDQHRVDGTWFRAVGFTNLTHDHLDYHGTLDEYFESKARLFDPGRAEAAAVNVDDPHGEELVRRARTAGMSVITTSIDDPASDLGATAVDAGSTVTRFELHDRRSAAAEPVTLRLLGRFNVANALVAAGVALAAGFDLRAVAAGLSADIVVPGRFESIDVGQPFHVVVDYAHTPDALATVLDSARGIAGPHRVIVVFGCGGERDRDKRPLMGRAAAERADLVLVTSDNPRREDPATIVDQVLVGVRPGPADWRVELDRRAAIGLAMREARAGDVVLIAGKGHEIEQTAAGVSRPFDDRAVAREALGESSWS
jgi:UDP-N-acetylmuramoyl-L-alanyl-D-glutamate--2,6-diaminopimelate ligase